GLHALFFGPGRGVPPRYRFDAPAGEYQVMYAGLSYEAALVETLFRNPRRRIVDLVELQIRSMATLTNKTKLRLVKAHGEGLAMLGTDAALATSRYLSSRRWALALWQHRDEPDGLVYLSRHNPGLLCAAFFDRSRARFTATTTPLLDDEARLGAVFAAHGKSIA
ncbi:MAG TPA: RES family NAD+ phosphorylase, partial [Stellaceae bacterium]|nr:RES family NAD+ phosphorylase [Stellaceae bacterium]